MSDGPPGWTRRELATGSLLLAGAAPSPGRLGAPETIALPPPAENGGMAVAAALARRRSVRHWRGGALRLGEIGQLLWAAQGVTDPGGLRAAPSAGAVFPLEIDLVAARVDGLAAGLHRYLPASHALVRRREGDVRGALAAAAHGQEWLASADAVLSLSAIVGRTAVRYGERAERYVAIEVGHAAENVYLQAAALDLGTVLVGAFDDARVAAVLALAAEERPFALLPVGRR